MSVEDIAGALFIAVIVSLVLCALFALWFTPKTIRVLREMHAEDVRAAAAASGDDQHPEWRDPLDQAVDIGNGWSRTPLTDRGLQRKREQLQEIFADELAEIRALSEYRPDNWRTD